MRPFIEKTMQADELNILIVDDHMIMRSVVEKHAHSLGFRNITFAVNGKEALEKAQTDNFDIILADWNMPELSGKDLLEEIRKDESYNNSAFVMISAEAQKSKMLEVMNAGATSYITKPFTEEGFKESLLNIISWLKEKRA